MSGISYDILMAPLEKLGLSRLRESLLSKAKGDVLEIGVGTGLNLRHYSKETQVTAIEPEESKRKRALKRSQNATIEEGDAENLRFGDRTFDTVVGTLVFCTIPHPEKAMTEIFRVLKPGGKFLMLEHVRSHSAAFGRLQDILTPPWKIFTEGCHLNRDPETFAMDVGFQKVSVKILWKGVGKIMEFRKP